MTETTDESWERLPDSRVRLPENALDDLVAALSDGVLYVGGTRIQLLDEGILISVSVNAGIDHGRLANIPIDVFIPIKAQKETT